MVGYVLKYYTHSCLLFFIPLQETETERGNYQLLEGFV